MKYTDLVRVIDRHGGEWADQIKMCSQCGQLVGFASDGAGCSRGECGGQMRPVSSFVDTHRVDNQVVLEVVEKLEDAAETAQAEGRRREKREMQEAVSLLRSENPDGE